MTEKRGHGLVATYRIQFHSAFPLEEAGKIVPYLRALGISHIYSSPLLAATPGSTHGYDGIDYTTINPELGGISTLEQLSQALEAQGMGLVMDMVPNHMAIHPLNPWWWDVLQNGPASRYASYFDVEWDPPEARHSDVVLVPVLGDQYGRILEAGEIQLAFDGAEFQVHYHDNHYPVEPGSLGGILSAAAERAEVEAARGTLAFLAGVHDRLPAATFTDLASARRRYRDAAVLRDLLGRFVREQPAAERAIREVVEAVNVDPDALDAFLQRQNYRLALWKISARELGYRRFFDINTLIGLRMESEEVYRETHALALDLLEQGVLDGLRIDHPDGLRDPGQYFTRLRESAVERGRKDVWIVIEKILEPGEKMPESWPVDGTTGYDFLNRVNGLLVDRSAEGPLSEFYTRFTGLSADYAALVQEKKRSAAYDVLGSDLTRLTELFVQVCERHRRYRDYTRSELARVLAETAACMPVYRTYACTTGEGDLISPADAAVVDRAVDAAAAARPELDPRLFDFLRSLLKLEVRGALEEELVARFQQFTGPVMAKGVEDTVFYIYNRFISLNEVGGDPGHFGYSPGEFHRACAETQERWPRAMLATSTHDTKRSEDVRARLNVISEDPVGWTVHVERWAQLNEPLRTGASGAAGGGDGRWPDRNTEYLFYQTVAGAWPIEADRVVEYMRKAGREAKVFTTWTTPDEAYEAAVEGFVRGALENERFTADMEAYVAGIAPLGRINTIAQTLLKLTTPGVPDIYQGADLWHYALVDPDNRRPVDYSARVELLASLSDTTLPEEMLSAEGVDIGLPKLWVTRQALALRRAHPECFDERGTYTPLQVEHDARQPEPALAFLRGGRVAVVAPRLPGKTRAAWAASRVELPRGRWQNLLTHETFDGGARTLAELFARFPAALLVKQ